MAAFPVALATESGVKRSREDKAAGPVQAKAAGSHMKTDLEEKQQNDAKQGGGATEPVAEHTAGEIVKWAGQSPQRLRIGPEHHNYVYTRVSHDLYKCCRPSEFAPTTHVLWLRLSPDGQWVAYDAPNDGSLPPMGQPVFSSREQVLVDGKHSWRMGMWDGRESKFMTTVL